MISWWRKRAPREQGLLALAAILLVAVLLIQTILMPSLAAHSRAQASVAEAGNTLVRLDRLKSAGTTYAPNTPISPAPDAVSRASVLASEAGLIPKTTPGFSSPYHLAFEPAEPTLVFSWLDKAESTLGLTVQSAEFTSSGSDLVEATIVFAEVATP